MVTVAFYTALHAVETLLAHDGVGAHPSHAARNRTLKTVNRYMDIWRHYRPLFCAARTARYDCEDASWLPVADVKGKLVPHLYRLEKSVLKLIGEGPVLPAIWDL